MTRRSSSDPAGVAQAETRIKAWSRVTFGTDTRAHTIVSDPVDVHTQCPPVNQVGLLNPGDSRSTGTLNLTGTCGFHDHGQQERRLFDGPHRRAVSRAQGQPATGVFPPLDWLTRQAGRAARIELPVPSAPAPAAPAKRQVHHGVRGAGWRRRLFVVAAGRVWRLRLSITLGPAPLDQGIVIYVHADFAGSSQQINVDVRDLTKAQGPCSSGAEGETPSWSECISSIRVLPGWSATLYRDEDFRGRSITRHVGHAQPAQSVQVPATAASTIA